MSSQPVRSTPLAHRPTVVQTPLAQRPIVAQPSSFLGTIKEGFAFGIGSSIARNVVDSFMSPAVKAEKPQITEIEKMTFTQCMDKTSGNYETCGHLE
jgi:hypothetical protein